MSPRAHTVLREAESIAGYTTYIDLIRPMIQGKKIISTGMKKEVDRVSAAIGLAKAGESCALVSSGDPGIYAMAGLALEICAKQDIHVMPIASFSEGAGAPADLYVEVVPGIPALCSGAALLGAPLTHDFAAISLSDLLTPWETIERRLAAAASADFVIVLYNPKSKKRRDQLVRAQEIILRHRDGGTPVGIVSSAMRQAQKVEITTLDRLHGADVTMLTTVFIGSTASVTYKDFMFTPRGYGAKYEL